MQPVPDDVECAWRVDRVTATEDGGRLCERHSLRGAVGRCASFDLPAVSGRQTWYHITAETVGGRETVRVQVFPPATRSSFTWSRPGRPDLRVYVSTPATVSAATAVVVVLHGVERNAVEYCDRWAGWATRQNRIVVSPRFDRRDWPGARSYALGNVLDEGGRPRHRGSWSFTAVTELHKYVRAGFGLGAAWFDLWGHSAGAQFVHRYLLFEPTAPVRIAIAANAGWYTLPDRRRPFPYGLGHPTLRFTRAELAAWVARTLVLMRGDRDTDRDPHLRATIEADGQGANRYRRAATMLASGRTNLGCRWRLVDVPGAAHDFTAMAAAAQDLLAQMGGPEPDRTSPLFAGSASHLGEQVPI